MKKEIAKLISNIECKFCNTIMLREGLDNVCDDCGATERNGEWTEPVIDIETLRSK